MVVTKKLCKKNAAHIITSLIGMFFGAWLVAVALEVFLIPNDIIDGGVIGLSMIIAYLTNEALLPYLLVLMNIPFIYLAYRSVGKSLVINMMISLVALSVCLVLMSNFSPYRGDAIEVIFAGGLTLGIGVGLIIRCGGALDGTEIVGIILHKTTGFTVGQVVLFFNIFIFVTAGFVYQDWHTAVQSLMTYIVAIKVMDFVIVGFDETKAVIIISQLSANISKAVMSELGLGLTVLYGRGGFSGEDQEILYVIIERLQLAHLKEIVHREDPRAFMAIENLHEVVNGRFERKSLLPSKNFMKPLKKLWSKKKHSK
jgi:uncharacterized membrane-anchored protein YitT (DUF2179 family)